VVNTITTYLPNFSKDLTTYNMAPYTYTNGGTCNPLPALLSDSTISAPIKGMLSNGTVNITYLAAQSGPPRGMGFSAINLNYTYYQIQPTYNDSLSSGSATTIQEEVARLLPLP
jgi:hypothetical protein